MRSNLKNSRESANAGGYKSPPHHTRFTKGVSGNPAGRPPGSGRMRQILMSVLCEKVPIRKGDCTIWMTKYEVILNVLVNAAVLQGNYELGLKLMELVPSSEMQRQVRRRFRDSSKMTLAEVQEDYWRMVNEE